jgi:hypothetical protein
MKRVLHYITRHKETHKFEPAEWQIDGDGFFDLEEIEEAPEQGQDEGGDHDEQEPVVVTHAPGLAAENNRNRSIKKSKYVK